MRGRGRGEGRTSLTTNESVAEGEVIACTENQTRDPRPITLSTKPSLNSASISLGNKIIITFYFEIFLPLTRLSDYIYNIYDIL